MDRQAWIAVTLCIVALFAWQIYVAKHTPSPPVQTALTPAPSASTTASAASTAQPAVAPSPSPNESTPTPTPAPRPFVERTATLSNSDLQLLLTNRGGGIA